MSIRPAVYCNVCGYDLGRTTYDGDAVVPDPDDMRMGSKYEPDGTALCSLCLMNGWVLNPAGKGGVRRVQR